MKTTISLFREPVVWFTTAARFLAAVYILVDPFWGLVWSVALDIVDGRVFLSYLKTGWVTYHSWDKIVDWFAYLAELAVVASYGWFMPMLFLMFYRLIGQILFVLTRASAVFIFFPNFFEAAFFWLVLFEITPLPLPPQLSAGGWLVVLLMAKEVQELLHHWWWPAYGMRPWRRFMLTRFGRWSTLAEFFSTDYEGKSVKLEKGS